MSPLTTGWLRSSRSMMVMPSELLPTQRRAPRRARSGGPRRLRLKPSATGTLSRIVRTSAWKPPIVRSTSGSRNRSWLGPSRSMVMSPSELLPMLRRAPRRAGGGGVRRARVRRGSEAAEAESVDDSEVQQAGSNVGVEAAVPQEQEQEQKPELAEAQ